MGTTGSDYVLISDDPANITVCFLEPQKYQDGVWRVTNSLERTVPLFVTQLIVVLSISWIFILLGRFTRTPRFVTEMIGAILMGPSALGNLTLFNQDIFQFRGNMVLETMANLGLSYYMFLVALDIDIKPLKRSGRKPIFIAVAGLLFPFAIGVSLFVFLRIMDSPTTDIRGSFFWGLALTVTSFPDLAQGLSDSSLLHTDIGKLAIISGVVSEIFVWFLLASAVTVSNPTFLPKITVFVIPVLYVYTVRPAVLWLIRRTSNGHDYDDNQLTFVVVGVAISAYVTEMCGLQSIFGAFLFGVVIPDGELKIKVKEKIEYFVTEILLPLFFLLSGFMFSVGHMMKLTKPSTVIVIIAMASTAKLLSTFLVCLFFNIRARDGFTLGVLLTTKGTLAILVLNVGRHLNALDNQTFTIMVVGILFMSMLIKPITHASLWSSKQLAGYESRSLQTLKPDTEFKILACIHWPQNVPAIIGIVDISNATERSPICVYAVQLVELTGRASAMVIIHDLCKSSSVQNKTLEKGDSDNIFHAFENYKNQNNAVCIQPLTSVSAYKNMDQDICNIAESKRVNLIIVPFHCKTSVDGTFKDDENVEVKGVNTSLLEKAPCSVGIFIDRGLSAFVNDESNYEVRRFAMFFIGGPDDREALTYASRMVEQLGVFLTVVRFIPGHDALEMELEDQPEIDILADNEWETQLDNEYINEFRFWAMNNSSITYTNRVVNSGDETLAVIRAVAQSKYNLFITGRNQGARTPVISGLSEWTDEFPEIGVLGNAIAISEFAKQISMLVVQNYKNAMVQEDSPLYRKPYDQPFSYTRRFDDSNIIE